MRARRSGQAMVETVVAVLIVTFVFLTLFKLSQMLMGKILLEHAAMRVARARAVGMNDFMCEKVARVAVIPIAGERERPGKDDVRTGISESAMARMYLRTPDSSYADGLLRYQHWGRLRVAPGHGGASHVSFGTDWFSHLEGEAEVDTFPTYLTDQGL